MFKVVDLWMVNKRCKLRENFEKIRPNCDTTGVQTRNYNKIINCIMKRAGLR